MFRAKTVVLLGAGASADYGLPLGAQLVDQVGGKIEEAIKRRRSHWTQHSFEIASARDFAKYRYDSLFFALDEVCRGRSSHIRSRYDFSDFSSIDLNAFEEFSKFVLNRGYQPSIDVMINDNPRFERVGKLCIALEIVADCIKEASDREGKFEYGGNVKIPLEKLSQRSNPNSWYPLFASQITSGATELKDIESGNLDIVTFNYDKICEQALAHFIRSQERFSSVDLGKVFRVHHVYGQISDELPQQSFPGDVMFRLVGAVVNSARNIHITRPRVEETEELSDIRRRLREAERIYCIGFSFDDMNVDVLNLRSSEVCRKLRVFNFGDSGVINVILRNMKVPIAQKMKGSSIAEAISENGFFRI